ncbi:MAG: hypothetical protein NT062_12705 [Proteobacteria bacterium]|nr:hypothetical protein [Pseudomonadota bacterium]
MIVASTSVVSAKVPAKPVATMKKKSRASRTHAAQRRFVTPAVDVAQTPAVRYGQLGDADCEAELKARKIAYTRETARGVRSPVRLGGPLHGVTFKTELPDKQRATTPWEIGDCRLVLAMDDFASILATHDVVEVHHYSMYRAPGKRAGDRQGSQHNGALALDAAKFITAAGTVLDVDKTFNGAINAKTCGPGAGPRPATADALALRAILCETVAQHLFNVVLTPNFNRPHHNHFHLEVTAGVTWFLVH